MTDKTERLWRVDTIATVRRTYLVNATGPEEARAAAREAPCDFEEDVNEEAESMTLQDELDAAVDGEQAPKQEG